MIAHRPIIQIVKHDDHKGDELQKHTQPHQLLRGMGEPPRIMLTRPNTSTTKTAAIANGTRL